MAYDEALADRIRKRLQVLPNVTEQRKMGGVTFTISGKVCVRAHASGELFLRCPPEMTDELLQKPGVKRFEMKNKKEMKGWLLIAPEAMRTPKSFEYWMKIALAHNSTIK